MINPFPPSNYLSRAYRIRRLIEHNVFAGSLFVPVRLFIYLLFNYSFVDICSYQFAM